MMNRRENNADKVRIRAYKISLDNPKLHLDNLTSPSMTTNYLFSTEPPPLPRKESISYPGTKLLQEKGRTTPLRHPSHDLRPLTTSPPPHPTSFDASTPASTRVVNGDASPADTTSTWSTAVGRATTGGKSGRVIERLMNDNDRLLREKRLATVKFEEEVKRGESARSALESLQLSNANLTSLHESDVALLAKRDRRIQQLRDDLEAERLKRAVAEGETRETRLERDATVDQLQRQASRDKEKCLRSTAQYETLSNSWGSLEDRYKRGTRKLMSDVTELKTAIEHDRQQLAQMDIVMEQMARESDKAKKAKDKLLTEFEAYKMDHENAIRDIREMAGENNRSTETAERQLVELVGHMRYVVNLAEARVPDLRRLSGSMQTPQSNGEGIA